LRAIRLLCAANLERVKGHIYLFEALRRVVDAGVDCRCVVAGKGPLRAELVRQTKKLRLENVVSMPGMIRHAELLQQMRSGAYDAVVLASVELGPEFEGIPVSLIEAMAAGIPCIATSTGAIGELIDARCGILVNQRDPRALGEAIIALASDPARRKALGQHAMGRIAEAFDARASARSLARLMTGAESSRN
jgi:glycosyltransferase involved in cell wall biosynthesis